MRIGIVSGEYPPMRGGVGAYSAILAQHWADMGHIVRLFSAPGVDTGRTDIPLTPAPDRWRWRSLRAVRNWARQEHLDIVSLQFQTAAFGMSPFIHFLPWALRGVAPLVTTFHDLRYPYLFPKAGPLRNWIVRHLAHSSAGAICTNPEDQQRINQLQQVTMIPIGSNIRAKSSIQSGEQWRSSNAEFLIGYFGFINHSKGVLELLHALHILVADQIPARLLLMGERIGSADATNRDFAAQVDERIAALNLAEHVVWTGYLDDDALGAALLACDVIALPFLDGASYRRGTLMAAIEFGCAIVTTEPRVPSPGFSHRDTLYLVPPGDAGALADALRTLREDSALRQHLRQQAQDLRQRFSWDHIAADCLSFFQRVKDGDR